MTKSQQITLQNYVIAMEQAITRQDQITQQMREIGFLREVGVWNWELTSTGRVKADFLAKVFGVEAGYEAVDIEGDSRKPF